jgi:hypothetical protein
MPELFKDTKKMKIIQYGEHQPAKKKAWIDFKAFLARHKLRKTASSK